MITVEIDTAEVQAALDRVAAHLTDMSDLMNEIGMFLVASTEQRFKDGKDPQGNPWAARSPVTIRHYELTGQSFGPVLHKTGDLGSSIHHQYDATSVSIGTNLIYSAVQQFGAARGSFDVWTGMVPIDKKNPDRGQRFHMMPIPWGNIPARPFIGLSAEDRTNILDTVEEWLAEITAG